MTMDIGGGSDQFIVWNGDGIQWAQGFDVGVAWLHMLIPWERKASPRCSPTSTTC